MAGAGQDDLGLADPERRTLAAGEVQPRDHQVPAQLVGLDAVEVGERGDRRQVFRLDQRQGAHSARGVVAQKAPVSELGLQDRLHRRPSRGTQADPIDAARQGVARREFGDRDQSAPSTMTRSRSDAPWAMSTASW